MICLVGDESKQLVVHIGTWTLCRDFSIFVWREVSVFVVMFLYHYFQEKTEDLKITYRSYQLEKKNVIFISSGNKFLSWNVN